MTPKLEVTSGPSRSILHTMAGRLQMLGHRSRNPRIPGFARCGVAVVLRWSGQWPQSMVQSVVRLVVWSGGPAGGPVGGPVPVSGPVGGLVCGLVCGPVRAVCGPSKHVLLRTMACQLQMVKGRLFFCNLCNSQKPRPGSAHTLPTKCGPRCFLAQPLGGCAGPLGNSPISLAFYILWSSCGPWVCASISWRLKRSEVLQLTTVFPLFGGVFFEACPGLS